MSLSRFASLPLVAAGLGACTDTPTAPASRIAAPPALSRASDQPGESRPGDAQPGDAQPGAVYTLTNGTGGNAVIAFRRAVDGTLTPIGTFTTGGVGTGGTIDPLVSQYAVVLAADHDALFAVDAGSDEVSSFRVGPDGALALAGTVSSYALGLDGSLSPITASLSTSGRAACWVTITADGRFAYVTNAGTSTVAGFAIGAAGQLTALSPGAATGTSGTGATPIDLDHVGSRFLYVLEAGTGTIGTFDIGAAGALTARADTPAGAPASGLQGLAAY
jgi:hypothetical protein